MTSITGGGWRKRRGQENSLPSHALSSIAKNCKPRTRLLAGLTQARREVPNSFTQGSWQSSTGVLAPVSGQQTTKTHACAPYLCSSPSLFPAYDAQVIS